MDTKNTSRRLKDNNNKDIFLRLISAGENLIIDACDGTETLANVRGVFEYLDPNFRNWGADESGLTTEKTLVEGYAVAKDGNFYQLLSSLSSDVHKLFFTQSQIIGFVGKYKRWLPTEGNGTFFPLISYKQLFVVRVRVGYFVNPPVDLRLYAELFHFELDWNWSAWPCHFLVVPQQTEFP